MHIKTTGSRLMTVRMAERERQSAVARRRLVARNCRRVASLSKPIVECGRTHRIRQIRFIQKQASSQAVMRDERARSCHRAVFMMLNDLGEE